QPNIWQRGRRTPGGGSSPQVGVTAPRRWERVGVCSMLQFRRSWFLGGSPHGAWVLPSSARPTVRQTGGLGGRLIIPAVLYNRPRQASCLGAASPTWWGPVPPFGPRGDRKLGPPHLTPTRPDAS